MVVAAVRRPLDGGRHDSKTGECPSGTCASFCCVATSSGLVVVAPAEQSATIASIALVVFVFVVVVVEAMRPTPPRRGPGTRRVVANDGSWQCIFLCV